MLSWDMQMLEHLYQAKERRQRVEAEIRGYRELGGEAVWDVCFPGSSVSGVVPAREAGLPAQLMPYLVGQPVGVAVKGVDHVSQIVACSRREIAEAAARQSLAEMQEGEVREAVVRALLPARRKEGLSPGLLLEVARDVWVEVYVPEALTWLSLPLARQYVAGQAVRVVVREIDREQGNLVVSVRAAIGDPWLAADLHPGARVLGYVYRIYPQRALLFVELRPHLVGLAPYFGDRRVRRGTKVVCRVKRIDPAQRKLRLAFEHVCV